MRVQKILVESLIFDNGTELSAYHDQGCCETVYADFSALRETGFENEILPDDVNDIKIEGVEGSGFRIQNYFVPCYNIQNGWYGSDLELQFIRNGTHLRRLDVSECVPEPTK